jgi:hypothetical protein
MSILSKSAYYAKEAFKFVMRIVLPFISGILLNWIFAFVFLFKWMGTASWQNSIPAIIMIAVFLAGFPFVYFWLGRGNALRQGVVGVYNSAHILVEKVVGNITQAAVFGSEKTGLGATFAGDKLKDKKGFIKSIDEKLPAPIRIILSFLLEQVPIAATLREVSATTELKKENLAQIQPIVQKRVDEFVEDRLIGDSVTFFWILAGVNILIMAAVWYFYS